MIPTIEMQIQESLAKVRPFLRREGGDVEFIDFFEGIVRVKMLGACAECFGLDDTIKNTVEMILIDEVPGVRAVQVVS
jgi:Fe-S cluster biogenesis protein NfuA